MGRLSGFPGSSGKARTTSADMGRTRTMMAQAPQGQTGALTERPVPNKLGASKAGYVSIDKCSTNCESPSECPQLSSPAPQIDSGASDSNGLDPLALPLILGHSSRRFAGFKTLFRTRRPRRQRLKIHIPKEEDTEDTCSEGPRGPAPTPEKDGDAVSEGNPATAVTQPSPSKAHLGDNEARKVSDTTEKSVNSNNTNITVCRHPSKRLSMPITVADQEVDHQDPFGDMWEASRSETNVSNPFTEHSKVTTESTGQSSSACNGSDNPFSSYPGHVLELSASSHSSWCCPTLSGFNGWPTLADRRLATDSFNKLASELYMEPLAINRDGTGQTSVDTAEENFIVARDKLERRRDRLLGRIRTMRSTIQIKSKPIIPRNKSLRRMKTFTELGSRPCLMTSLRGKPLESLARLGGYSFLTLPGDFAPTTLSLPVCFVATIDYLRYFAPAVQNLFVDPGDLETVTQTYDYFAEHVLSAEKEKSTIHMTMRSSRMPRFLDEVAVPGMETRSPAQVLSIAFAFKALLAGLPGGILGSVQLYRILVNICYGRVSQGPVQRTGSCLAGLSSEDYAKVRAMSLAILALTSSMQLNLICGVFGLCSLLLHETERMFELERRMHRSSNRRPITSSADKLSADRLAATLGPLLAETGRGSSPDTFRAIQQEIESQRVAALLVGNWRSVSRQLRIWERRGLEGKVQAAVSRTASGESAGTGTR
ncbi:hypothetical protein BDW59DRAFT_29918 [Aspergillus cavernicola]|uniref:Uncharacterized protein n=1 Tax=Aspergillus cavernicola TaxID=176166 RepID=A0ABR4IR56_9EURO